MTTGEKIKHFRKKVGMTQVQLSEVTGINLTTIKRYETDIIEPKLININKIAEALDVNTAQLVEIYTKKGEK